MKRYRGDKIDCIPTLNIDGVLLAKQNPQYALWKANIRGVDLNVNFDAEWGGGEQNVFEAGAENFVGEHPHSEAETLAVVKLLERRRYDMVIAYHSKGEEIYYGFLQDDSGKAEAEELGAYLGYAVKKIEGSCGGLKDYFVLKYKKPALTIEVGEDRFAHPYPLSELPALCKLHEGTLELFETWISKDT
jgi:g-D-glutamyl-meso-diaminopimelate peptidase